MENELRQLFEDYKILYSGIDKIKKQNEFLIARENKLQQIEQLFENEPVDLEQLYKLVKGGENND